MVLQEFPYNDGFFGLIGPQSSVFCSSGFRGIGGRLGGCYEWIYERLWEVIAADEYSDIVLCQTKTNAGQNKDEHPLSFGSRTNRCTSHPETPRRLQKQIDDQPSASAGIPRTKTQTASGSRAASLRPTHSLLSSGVGRRAGADCIALGSRLGERDLPIEAKSRC